MTTIQCDLEPAFGFAVVLMEKQEKSAGGIVVPDTASKPEMARFKIVATSEGYMDGGAMIPSTLQPGDEVVIAPNGSRRILDSSGPKPVERAISVQRLMSSPLLPDDCYLVLLADIAGRVPADKVKPVVGEKPLIKLVQGQVRH